MIKTGDSLFPFSSWLPGISNTKYVLNQKKGLPLLPSFNGSLFFGFSGLLEM
jgi:hypothetical protein